MSNKPMTVEQNTQLTTLATGLFNKTNWCQSFYAE